jgi:hypothetical protein
MTNLDKDLAKVLSLAGVDPALASDALIAMADRLLMNHQGSLPRAAEALRPYAHRAAAVTNNAAEIKARAVEQSSPAQSYFSRAQSGLDGEGAVGNRSGAYLTGSEPTASVPKTNAAYWAEADSGVEPPLPADQNDMASPVLNQALGGASEPAPEPAQWQCPYGQVDACVLVDQGIGICVCETLP